jgi:predicted O-methyltransferase YrrM
MGAQQGAALSGGTVRDIMTSATALARRVVPQALVTWRRRIRLEQRAERLARRLAHTADPHEWWTHLEAQADFRPLQKRSELVALMRLLAAMQPSRVCEIGSASGGTLCALARSARPDATLVTVDLHITPERRAAFPRFARDGQRIVCIEGNSQQAETWNAVVRAIADAPLDVLLIDGDHSYGGVSRDYALYAPLVRRGGLVILHDIVLDIAQREGRPTHASTGGVPYFWRELRSRYAGARELIEDPSQDGYGLGLLVVQ